MCPTPRGRPPVHHHTPSRIDTTAAASISIIIAGSASDRRPAPRRRSTVSGEEHHGFRTIDPSTPARTQTGPASLPCQTANGVSSPRCSRRSSPPYLTAGRPPGISADFAITPPAMKPDDAPSTLPSPPPDTPATKTSAKHPRRGRDDLRAAQTSSPRRAASCSPGEQRSIERRSGQLVPVHSRHTPLSTALTRFHRVRVWRGR